MVEIANIHKVLSNGKAIRSESKEGFRTYFYLENGTYYQVHIHADKWGAEYDTTSIEEIRYNIDHRDTDVTIVDLSRLPDHR